MFILVIFHLFYVHVKICCICGGTKREVIPVKYGRELTLTRYMHPLQNSTFSKLQPRGFIIRCNIMSYLVQGASLLVVSRSSNTPKRDVLGITLTYIWWWGSSSEDLQCGVPFHYSCSRVLSNQELGSHVSVK